MKVKEKKSAKEVLITEFLGKINPSGWRTNRKAALSDLEYTILNNGQQIDFPEASLVKMLLAGTKHHPKGLLRICGEHSVSNLVTPALTRAAIIAMKLLAKLFDASIYPGAKYFHEHLKTLPTSCLSLPNFGHHLVRDNALEASPELFDSAMHVITAFMTHVPSLKLSDFISDDWARYFYLRQSVGYYTQNPNDKYWETCIFSSNFSHSMIIEFLSTGKHRMSRDLWLRSITSYLIKCKPVLRDDTLEPLLAGTCKTTRGLLHMCNKKNSYAPAAKQLLAQLIDESLYPGAGRIVEFLMKHKKLLAQLTLPIIFEKQLATADDEKIYKILTYHSKNGGNKEALLVLTQKPKIEEDDEQKTDALQPEPDPAPYPDSETDPDLETEPEPMMLEEYGIRRDASLDSLKKACGKFQRCPSTDVSWGDISSQGSSFPSVLSVLEEVPWPQTPTSPNPVSSYFPSSPLAVPLDYLSSRTPTSPDHPSYQMSSPRSISPFSSGRTSEEYPEGEAMLEQSTTLISSPVSPRVASNQAIAVLTSFFEAHGPFFTRIDYRRLLIFLLSLVTLRGGKLPDVDSSFMELGLDSNPQFEVSVARLFEELDRVDANFNDELSNRWASCIMREIASTERNLDP